MVGQPRGARPIFPFLLASLLVIAVPVSGTFAARVPRQQIKYQLWATPIYVTVCAGETEEVTVAVQRITTVNGNRYDSWVAGGRVAGIIDNGNLLRFQPTDAGRDVEPGSPPVATFTLIGQAPGRTDIEFQIMTTGEEQRVGANHPMGPVTVHVEVKSCFDAYTSGLATIFDISYMGALDQPFFLEGHIATTQVQGATQFMFFAPNPRNHTTGGYAFIDTAWPAAGPGGRCTAYVGGGYDVVFYPDEAHVVEGDLLMKGTGVAYCPGIVIPIDYTSAPGFQIAFKPLPPILP